MGILSKLLGRVPGVTKKRKPAKKKITKTAKKRAKRKTPPRKKNGEFRTRR